MDKLVDIPCKDPSELSQQDQQVLMRKLEQHFQGQRFASQEEGESAVRAAIAEYLGCSPQVEPEPNFAWVPWLVLAMVLLAGVWLYWSRSQGLVG
ncbi:MAG: hypothetical protein ABG776_01635 [Cyanobacteria bacterium J06555_13]